MSVGQCALTSCAEALASRIADTRELLAGVIIAAELSDGVVASMNSNLGRVMLTMAGRDKLRRGLARSVDLFWVREPCATSLTQ